MTMFHDDKDVEKSWHQLTTIHIRRKKTIAHYEKISTFSHSANSKTEIKKVPMINVCQPLPLEPPFSVPAIKMNGFRPKNFRVRVYRNGDDSMCAYCASCTMNITLSDATRKLQMIRPAQRLFDCNGHEIFRSEDIHRDKEYYVSEGEDFISPLEAIKSKIRYRDHSKWTIYGIESSYIIKRQRRRRRRFTSVGNSILPNYEEKLPIHYEDKGIQTGENISFDNKDTQTITKCENKYMQTDRKVSLGDKNTQTTTKYENKDMQTDGKTSLENKDTQTTVKLEHKDMQTDEKTSLESKDTQTIIKLEHKDIQTDEKALLESKDTQTTTKYEDREVMTDIWIAPPPLHDNEINGTTTPPDKDKREPNPTEPNATEPNPREPNPREPNPREPDPREPNPREPNPREPDPREPNPREPNPREPNPREPNPREPDPREPNPREPNPREPDPREPNPREPNPREPNPREPNPREPNPREPNPRQPNQKKLDSPRSGRTTPVASSLDAIYRRSSPTTNFRVKVYRNGEHSRYAYCKSCTMDIILSSATQKLQMPIPARRLFDPDGVEIFDSKYIRRDSEYYVSSGGNFKKPSQ